VSLKRHNLEDGSMPAADNRSTAVMAADVSAAVTGFVVAIEDDFPSDEARLAATARALDRLSLAYHEGADLSAQDSEGEPPQRDYQALREMVGERFPTLGYYATAPAGETLEAEVTMGDAIDDLTDIYSELMDVAWCFANTTAEDAVRLYRFGFAHHWGRHVCDVRGAIHYELFGM
jgi:hypothetical protein